MFDYHSWIILPLIIFISRVCDVSLGTIRNLMIGKGYRKLAPILGFFEVLIWIVVVSQVMKNLDKIACYFAWAAGFATGTYVGLFIEGKIALGLQLVRVFIQNNSEDLIDELVKANHGVTVVNAHGAKAPVKMIYLIVKRKYVQEVIELIDQKNPSAFFTVEDIKSVRSGVFREGSDPSAIGKWLGIK